jgi:hypothetical protein
VAALASQQPTSLPTPAPMLPPAPMAAEEPKTPEEPAPRRCAFLDLTATEKEGAGGDKPHGPDGVFWELFRQNLELQEQMSALASTDELVEP